MALTSTQKSICNKMLSDYPALVAPVKSAKGSIKAAARNLDSSLRSITFSDDNTINNAIDQLQDGVNEVVPGNDLDSMNDLKTFIDQCDYMKTFAPVSAVIGTVGGVFDEITNLVNNLNGTVPEFGAGALADTINSLLDGANFPGGDALSDLMKLADELINCVALGCAASDPSYIGGLDNITTDLQGLYDELNIVDDPADANYGKFDYESVYDDVGMSVSQKDKIDRVVESIGSQKSGAIESINSSISSVKSLAKIGGFF